MGRGKGAHSEMGSQTGPSASGAGSRRNMGQLPENRWGDIVRVPRGGEDRAAHEKGDVSGRGGALQTGAALGMRRPLYRVGMTKKGGWMTWPGSASHDLVLLFLGSLVKLLFSTVVMSFHGSGAPHK